MTISINGALVHRVDLLHVPYAERWTLEIAYPGDVVPVGLVTVQWGEASFVGTVDPEHGGAFNGEVIIKIVAGWGWSTELPAAWYQSDNPGVRGRTVATKAAQAVGETLYGSTGQTPPNENLFRPLRVSYSRSKQTAGSVLRDVLAQGVAWWVDFEGATRVGVRMAPSPVRVALLDYEVGSKWADLECDDPSNLMGATIPADPIRGTPALVINELFAWTDDKGFRYRAAVAPVAVPESSRLVTALRELVQSFVPEIPALKLRRARIVSQSSDGRLSVQQVERDGVIVDIGAQDGAVRYYAGSPGISAELDLRGGATPETILAFCRADWSDPIAFLAPPKGQPGHVPFRVAHEADNTIRFVGASNGVVRVGAAPTSPVALAAEVGNTFDLVVSSLAAIVAYANAVGAAVPAAAPAAATLTTALSTPLTGFLALIAANETAYTATRLEAK